jgi:poly-beta-1,6-N-acetyl-D-glucosamine synthase
MLIFLSTLFPIIHLFQAIFMALKNRREEKFSTDMVNKFSILIPCYNEEDIIHTSIKGIMELDYDKYEVIYINDGSTDDTFEALDKHLHLRKQSLDNYPLNDFKIKGYYRSELYNNIYVIDKINGGKAESLNFGISYANHELVVTLDADSILKRNSLRIIDGIFSDEKVIAAGGVVHVMQSSFSTTGSKSENELVRLQALDYIKGFYIYKASLACEDALAIISGAFGIFRRSVLLEVGGYRNTLGEDIDITLRFQKYALKNKKTIKFIPSAICYTECPESWTDLFKQRIRWQKAFVDCLIKYKFLILRLFLLKAVYFYLFIEAFLVGTASSVFSIVMALTALFSNSHQVRFYFIFYFLVSTFFSLIYSVTAIKISNIYSERKFSLKYFGTTIVLDILFYRYINIIYYLSGTVLYFFNNKSWNKVKRSKRIYELSQ